MRKKLDNNDRELMFEKLRSFSHPLISDSDKLYNIATGQVAPPEVNAQNAVEIGEHMKSDCVSSYSDVFHQPL